MWQTSTQGYDPNANGVAEAYAGIIKACSRELLLDARLATKWWGMAALAAANILRSRTNAPLHPNPASTFGSRVMLVRGPRSRNAFDPIVQLGVIFGPAGAFSSSFWVHHESYVYPRANVQDLGLEAPKLQFTKLQLADAGAPIAEFLDPALRDPALLIEPAPSDTAAKLLLPRCPAC